MIISVLVVYVLLLHVASLKHGTAYYYFIAFMIMQYTVFLVHGHGFSMP